MQKPQPINLKPALPLATPLSCLRHCVDISLVHWCTSAAWYECPPSTTSGTYSNSKTPSIINAVSFKFITPQDFPQKWHLMRELLDLVLDLAELVLEQQIHGR